MIKNRKSSIIQKLQTYGKELFLFFLFLFICIANCSCTNLYKINAQNYPSCVLNKKYKKFNIIADSYLTESDFKGTVLLAKSNKIIFAKGYGLKDSQNPQEGENNIFTSFEAGSLTKQITAAAILKLEEEKKLSIKDKLSMYFPDFILGNDITIEMLLNMRSGLVDHINASDEFFPPEIYSKILKAQLNCNKLDNNIVIDNLNYAKALAKPDETFFYCNTNYFLLAKIIQQVSGLDFKDYIQKNIFDICHMNCSNLDFQKSEAKSYDNRNIYYSIPEALALGCGDLNTNVLDLLKWNLKFNSKKVIKNTSYKKMVRNEGYGFGIYSKDNCLFHAGNTNLFNSHNSFYLDKKISVIVLVNEPIYKSNASNIARKLYQFYLESL